MAPLDYPEGRVNRVSTILHGGQVGVIRVMADEQAGIPRGLDGVGDGQKCECPQNIMSLGHSPLQYPHTPPHLQRDQLLVIPWLTHRICEIRLIQLQPPWEGMEDEPGHRGLCEVKVQVPSLIPTGDPSISPLTPDPGVVCEPCHHTRPHHV